MAGEESGDGGNGQREGRRDEEKTGAPRIINIFLENTWAGLIICKSDKIKEFFIT
jgi:hypothetical protein